MRRSYLMSGTSKLHYAINVVNKKIQNQQPILQSQYLPPTTTIKIKHTIQASSNINQQQQHRIDHQTKKVSYYFQFLNFYWFMSGTRPRPPLNPKAYQQLNVGFYKQLLKWISDKQDTAMYDRLIKRQVAVEQQLSHLTPQQRLQWSSTLTLKYRQLHQSRTNQLADELIATLFVLVQSSKTYQIPYDYLDAHSVIKKTYYQIYKDKVVELFKKCGFDTTEFEVLEYTDPILTRIWRAIFE